MNEAPDNQESKVDSSRLTQWVFGADSPHGVTIGLNPAIGHHTMSVELNRVRGYTRTGHEGANSCYIDAETEAGIVRLTEGEVRSLADLEAAENALQAVFWHDRVDVLRPAFVFGVMPEDPPEWVDPWTFGIFLPQQDERTELSDEIFALCDPIDLQFSVESVLLQGESISRSAQRRTVLGRCIPGTGRHGGHTRL